MRTGSTATAGAIAAQLVRRRHSIRSRLCLLDRYSGLQTSYQAQEPGTALFG